MYAISRIESKRGFWCWAVLFRRRNQPIYKRFFDIKCGGSKKAKATAVAWRDEQLARAQGFTLREFCQIRRSNNSSGTPGVILAKRKAMPRGLWQARLRLPNNKYITKSFGVAKYGNKEAFVRAVAARLEMVRSAEDRPYVNHPIAKEFAARRLARTTRSPGRR
jgi:hypothetical protein